jgi:hypothetical protein
LLIEVRPPPLQNTQRCTRDSEQLRQRPTGIYAQTFDC